MTSSIKEGVFAYVGGTVSRVFETKNGPAFNMEIQREGSQYPDRVTCWGTTEGLNVGDRVKVKGWLSWRRQVKDDKTYLNVSVNSPEVTDHEPATRDVQPAREPWESPEWATTPPGGEFGSQSGADGFTGYNDESQVPF